jgi:hypothetical protein
VLSRTPPSVSASYNSDGSLPAEDMLLPERAHSPHRLVNDTTEQADTNGTLGDDCVYLVDSANQPLHYGYMSLNGARALRDLSFRSKWTARQVDRLQMTASDDLDHSVDDSDISLTTVTGSGGTI